MKSFKIFRGDECKTGKFEQTEHVYDQNDELDKFELDDRIFKWLKQSSREDIISFNEMEDSSTTKANVAVLPKVCNERSESENKMITSEAQNIRNTTVGKSGTASKDVVCLRTSKNREGNDSAKKAASTQTIGFALLTELRPDTIFNFSAALGASRSLSIGLCSGTR
jgi:hypothetical protein